MSLLSTNTCRAEVRAGLGLCLAVGLAFLVGCDRQEPQSYSVPKEPSPPVSPGASAQSPHGDMVPGMAVPQLEWTLPEGWYEAAASEMSLANFMMTNNLGEASVSAIPLPTQVVQEVEVINIFRERFRMQPLDRAGLAELAQTVPIGPGEGHLYDMQSEADADHAAGRVIVGVLSLQTTSLYVRLTGDAAAVEAEKPAFLDFLGSLRVTEPPVTLTMSPHGGSPQASTPGGASSGGGAGLPEWTVPASWTVQPPPRMVLASFATGPGDHAANVTVSAFPGDVGGAAANINRWRGQIGLSTLSEAEALASLSQLEMADGEGQMVELKGDTGGEAMGMIGVIVPRGGRTWFYKMVGHAHSVEAEKAAFLEFLRNAKHPQ